MAKYVKIGGRTYDAAKLEADRKKRKERKAKQHTKQKQSTKQAKDKPKPDKQ